MKETIHSIPNNALLSWLCTTKIFLEFINLVLTFLELLELLNLVLQHLLLGLQRLNVCLIGHDDSACTRGSDVT